MATRPDPRPSRPSDTIDDVRPSVASSKAPFRPWLFGGAAAAAVVILFVALNERREEATAPSVRARAREANPLVSAAPPLYVPPALSLARPDPTAPLPRVQPVPVSTPLPSPTPVPVITPKPQPIVVPSPAPVAPFAEPSRPQPNSATPGNQSSPLVIDMSSPRAEAQPTQTAETGAANQAPAAIGKAGRATAGRFRRRTTTIAQGTLIPAVLETALDSTRPGQARALVSRDVHGYGGSALLIPRGSRLYGEYRADLAPGQNRAFVQWSRLVRPDGVTIAIDSPAADSLGRSGIRGRVNSHFLERFGSALLQTSLNIGTSVAASKLGNGSVLVALPTGGLGVASQLAPQQVQPTLKVRQGTAISVFVARDLDFSAVSR